MGYCCRHSPIKSPSFKPKPWRHPACSSRQRVQAHQASEGDPLLLQPLEVRIVILSPPRILTGVQKVDFQHGKVLKLAVVHASLCNCMQANVTACKLM